MPTSLCKAMEQIVGLPQHWIRFVHVPPARQRFQSGQSDPRSLGRTEQTRLRRNLQRLRCLLPGSTLPAGTTAVSAHPRRLRGAGLGRGARNLPLRSAQSTAAGIAAGLAAWPGRSGPAFVAGAGATGPALDRGGSGLRQPTPCASGASHRRQCAHINPRWP